MEFGDTVIEFWDIYLRFIPRQIIVNRRTTISPIWAVVLSYIAQFIMPFQNRPASIWQRLRCKTASILIHSVEEVQSENCLQSHNKQEKGSNISDLGQRPQ